MLCRFFCFFFVFRLYYFQIRFFQAGYFKVDTIQYITDFSWRMDFTRHQKSSTIARGPMYERQGVSQDSAGWLASICNLAKLGSGFHYQADLRLG